MSGKDTTHGDNLDIAAELQQKYNDDALAEIARKNLPETHPDFDGKHCIGCGEDMPPLRLQMKRIRCVHCQHEKEVKERLG